MKRILTLLFVTVLLLGLAAGCTSGTNGTSPSASSSDTPDGIASPAQSGRTKVQLPLTTETVTLSWWQGFSPFMFDYMNGTDDNPMFTELSDRTNVKIKWIDVSAAVAFEQFSVMIGSGEYPDIMNNLNMMYSGGAQQALEDDVVVELSQYLNIMPNFKYWVDQPEFGRIIYSDNGTISQFPQVNDGGIITISGLATRTAWLEELGKSAPTTYDEMFDLLKAYKTEYGATIQLPCFGVQRNALLQTGFNVYGSYGNYGGMVDYPFYQVDGVTKFGILEPEFKEYLEMLNEWWNAGVIDPDFVAYTDRDVDTARVVNGTWGVFPLSADSAETYEGSTDEDMRMTPIQPLTKTKNEDGKNVGILREMVSNVVGNSVTTQCDNIETAMRLFDYLYSEEGAMLANFGVENISYTLDASGTPRYTDIILNNEEGLSSRWALFKYCYQGGSYAVDYRRTELTSTARQMEFRETYSIGISDDWTWPTGVELTAAEGDQFGQLYPSIDTYISENIPQFIMGIKSFDEYDDFLGWLYDMDIETCISLYQDALDRFYARG